MKTYGTGKFLTKLFKKSVWKRQPCICIPIYFQYSFIYLMFSHRYLKSWNKIMFWLEKLLCMQLYDGSLGKVWIKGTNKVDNHQNYFNSSDDVHGSREGGTSVE